MHELVGRIADDNVLIGSLEIEKTIVGTLSELTDVLKGQIIIPAHIDKPPTYLGEVDITPDAHSDIVLKTAYTTLEKDITISKIPTFETSNNHGTTFIIGVVN